MVYEVLAMQTLEGRTINIFLIDPRITYIDLIERSG
jgi:hypothetical protein